MTKGSRSTSASTAAEGTDATSQEGETGLQVGRDVLRIEAEALVGLGERFDEEAFRRAVNLLLDCSGRVICMGMGKSGVIGKKLAGTLASTGSPSFFLHPAEAGHGDLGMVVDGDVVVALSYSGETAEILALLPRIKRLGVPLIALVGDTSSALAREGDVVLDVGVEEEACPLGLAPTASTTAALAMGDALAMAVLTERGFGAEEFAAVHPKGRLGRQLLRVRQVMHTGEELPRVHPGDRLDTVVEEMSRKRLGMTSVVDDEDRLVGVITDGDLRRLIRRSGVSPDCSARDCMTPDPVCISADALATEALRLLEEGAITSLLVVDDGGKLRGVVHLHDLWRTEMI